MRKLGRKSTRCSLRWAHCFNTQTGRAHKVAMAVKDESKPAGDGKAAGKDDKKKGAKEVDKEPELSEEDLELKKNLELMIERVGEADPGGLLGMKALHACTGPATAPASSLCVRCRSWVRSMQACRSLRCRA